jgi:Fe-S cluster assembly protein SufB
MLEYRLKAYRHWLTMPEPQWAKIKYQGMDYQDAYYYASPKNMKKPKSLDEVDPKLLETYKKLGIPLKEQEMLAGVAVDTVGHVEVEVLVPPEATAKFHLLDTAALILDLI